MDNIKVLLGVAFDLKLGVTIIPSQHKKDSIAVYLTQGATLGYLTPVSADLASTPSEVLEILEERIRERWT